jgi:hypothetical protein
MTTALRTAEKARTVVVRPACRALFVVVVDDDQVERLTARLARPVPVTVQSDCASLVARATPSSRR